MYVGVDGRGMVGRLGFRDALRADSADVVRRLQDMSIRVALLSGDNAAAVAAAAAQAGIQVPILHLPWSVSTQITLPGFVAYIQHRPMGNRQSKSRIAARPQGESLLMHRHSRGRAGVTPTPGKCAQCHSVSCTQTAGM